MRDPGCVFCGIVDGSVPASRAFESERVLVFMDTDPVTPGHVLVVPKMHLRGLADLLGDVGCEMWSVAGRMATALRRTDLRCAGVNLFYADGEAAGQEVLHAHLHVFPRFTDDGFVIDARWGSSPSRDELDEIASRLRRAAGTQG